MDKVHLVTFIENLIKTYNGDVNNDFAKGASIAMTGLLAAIKDGQFDNE